MEVIRFSEQEERAYGFTHKVILDHTDLTAAAGAADTTATIQIFPGLSTATVPAGTVVARAGFNLITAFDASDAAINSLLLEVGDGNDTDRFIPQKELAVDGTEVLFWVTSHATTTLPFAYTASDGIDAKFTVAGGASPLIDELNAGKVEIYLHISDLNKLE